MLASKSKSKSKDKTSARAAKVQQKASLKASAANNASGSAASGYNPISGTFHIIETSTIATSPPFHNNGRFRNIGDTDDHSSSPHSTVSEYDLVSNNGSCSGESEDTKEKNASNTPRQETIPGTDGDRREKIRLKNERKHQRQKERRAQELHDRCISYLMSRKLDILSQQLVAMGFSSERATLALMLNEGKLEESVSWLCERSGGAQNKETSNIANGGGTLKIDVSEELNHISALEALYKCSKQEVERAVVACEGNLEKVEESLRAQKQVQPPPTQSKSKETENGNMVKTQESSPSLLSVQYRMSERDSNHINGTNMVSTRLESGSNGNFQSSKINQPKSLLEKRWLNNGSGHSTPTLSPPPEQVVPEKVENWLDISGNERRNISQGMVREPVIVMQRPQSIDAKPKPVPTAFPLGTTGCYANNNYPGGMENTNGNMSHNQNMRNFRPEDRILDQFYYPAPYKEAPCMVGSSSLMAPSEHRGSSSTIGGASSSSLAVPSSVGLFSGRSSARTYGTLSQVDWNTGGMMPDFDYTTIDWTLNYPSSNSSGSWLRNGSGMMTNGGAATESFSTSATGLREWTSPFAGKDILNAPRQFVTSPSP